MNTSGSRQAPNSGKTSSAKLSQGAYLWADRTAVGIHRRRQCPSHVRRRFEPFAIYRRNVPPVLLQELSGQHRVVGDRLRRLRFVSVADRLPLLGKSPFGT
jgi:hypothetical protein